jgi:hypothetical protein
LEVETLEVELGQVAGFVSVLADGDLFFEVGEVVVGELFGSLGDDEVCEGGAHGEDGLLHSELELGIGLHGGGACGVEAPAALLAALEEAAYAEGEAVWVVEVLGLGKVGSVESEVGVLAGGGLDLLRLDGEQVLFGGKQGWVLGARHIDGLLHGERRGLVLC